MVGKLALSDDRNVANTPVPAMRTEISCPRNKTAHRGTAQVKAALLAPTIVSMGPRSCLIVSCSSNMSHWTWNIWQPAKRAQGQREHSLNEVTSAKLKLEYRINQSQFKNTTIIIQLSNSISWGRLGRSWLSVTWRVLFRLHGREQKDFLDIPLVR